MLSILALSLALPAAASGAPDITPYRGLGSWVDIFDRAAAANADATVRSMARNGVRTLYLETSNSGQSQDIVRRAAVARFIEASHRLGMKVVAWYLPTLTDLRRDLRRSRAAIRFQTLGGERFDSFGLDIESSRVRPASRRTHRLLALSTRLRRTAGSGYPLSAIIPAPRGMQLSPSYWPGFPYAGLRRRFDAFLPMGYFTYRVKRTSAVYDYTARNAAIIRQKTGDPAVPIHLVGGIANRAAGPQVAAFARAATDSGAIGASLYDYPTTGPEDWLALRRFRPAAAAPTSSGQARR